MNELQEIAARVKAGESVTPEEFAYLVKNDKEALFAFMILNNPGSMNNVLRHKLRYTELGFAPDINKLQRICQMILDRNNVEEIQVILNNFQFNLDTLSPLVKAAILNN